MPTENWITALAPIMIGLLIAVLLLKELLRASDSARARNARVIKWMRALSLMEVPLLAVFVITVAVRLFTLISRGGP
jgi:hypothetical protein